MDLKELETIWRFQYFDNSGQYKFTERNIDGATYIYINIWNRKIVYRQEKEKLINTLVDYIAKEDIDELVCKHIKCVDNEEEKDCRECVKKFFESKIKESEN